MRQALASFPRAASASPADEFVATERAALLHEAIADLPPRLRSVVEEVFLKQRSRGEVAEELGVQRESMRQDTMRALKRLRKLLDTRE